MGVEGDEEFEETDSPINGTPDATPQSGATSQRYFAPLSTGAPPPGWETDIDHDRDD